MRFRLSHIVSLMLLVLMAGVLSVRQLEEHVGKSSVPGVIVVDAPAMDLGLAETLSQRWPGAILQWVASDGQPVAPFSGSSLQVLREGGWLSLLLAPGADQVSPPPAIADLHRTWGVVVTELPAADAPASLAAFVGEQGAGRPFVAGLALPEAHPAQVVASIGPLVAAADGLPSFRRTAIVVLGAREEGTHRRLALRIDRGPWGAHVRPLLADLLPEAGSVARR